MSIYSYHIWRAYFVTAILFGLFCFYPGSTVFAQSETIPASGDDAHPFAHHRHAKGEFYTASGNRTFTTPVTCGGGDAKIISTCSMADTGAVSCSSQQLVMPTATADLTMPQFNLGEWGCARHDMAAVWVFEYENGGDCATCERFEIHDLSGERIADWQHFNPVYEELNMPVNSKETPEAFSKQMKPVDIGN